MPQIFILSILFFAKQIFSAPINFCLLLFLGSHFYSIQQPLFLFFISTYYFFVFRLCLSHSLSPSTTSSTPHNLSWPWACLTRSQFSKVLRTCNLQFMFYTHISFTFSKQHFKKMTVGIWKPNLRPDFWESSKLLQYYHFKLKPVNLSIKFDKYIVSFHPYRVS